MKSRIQILAFIATAMLGMTFAGADETNPPATQPSPANFVAVLGNGVSIELLGINENPSAGKKWWKADGTPLDIPPYAMFGATAFAQANQVAREIAVKTQTSVQGTTEPATVRWTLVGSGGAAGSTPMSADGNTIQDIEAQAIAAKDEPNGAILRADIAAETWTTICKCQGNGQMAMGSIFGNYEFGNAFSVNSETHIVVGCPYARNLDMRLVAIDRAGRQRVAMMRRNSSSDIGMLAEFSVRIPVNSIRQWQLQSRPFDQWIEIRHISLHRDQNTQVEITTSDGKAK